MTDTPRIPRNLQRLGIALYVMLITVLLASVIHGVANLPAL